MVRGERWVVSEWWVDKQRVPLAAMSQLLRIGYWDLRRWDEIQLLHHSAYNPSIYISIYSFTPFMFCHLLCPPRVYSINFFSHSFKPNHMLLFDVWLHFSYTLQETTTKGNEWISLIHLLSKYHFVKYPYNSSFINTYKMLYIINYETFNSLL